MRITGNQSGPNDRWRPIAANTCLYVVALNQDAKANLGKKIGFTLARRPDMKLVLDRIRNKRERAGVFSAFVGDFLSGADSVSWLSPLWR